MIFSLLKTKNGCSTLTPTSLKIDQNFPICTQVILTLIRLIVHWQVKTSQAHFGVHFEMHNWKLIKCPNINIPFTLVLPTFTVSEIVKMKSKFFKEHSFLKSLFNFKFSCFQVFLLSSFLAFLFLINRLFIYSFTFYKRYIKNTGNHFKNLEKDFGKHIRDQL